MEEVSNMENINSKFGKSAFLAFTGICVSTVFKYAFRVLIARSYSPSGYGLFYLGIAFLTVLSNLAILGTSKSTTRWVSYFIEDGGMIKGVVFSAMKIAIPFSLIISSILFFNAGPLSRMIGKPEFIPVLKVFSIAVPFMAFYKVIYSWVRGLQNTVIRVLVFDILKPGLFLVSILVSLYMGLSLNAFAGIYTISISVMAGASFIVFRKVSRPQDVQKKFSARRMFFFSWPIMFSSMLFMAVEYTDIIMLGFMETSYSLGVYNAALPVASTLMFVMYAFGYLLMPKISEIVSKSSKEKVAEVYSRVVWWIFLFTVPGFLLLFGFSQEILSLFFGTDFVAGSGVLRVLSTGFFLTAIIGPIGDFFVSLGDKYRHLMIYFAIAVPNIVFNYLLIPEYGFMGAGVSLAVSLVFGKGLGMFLFWKETGRTPFGIKFLKLFLLNLMTFTPFFVSSRIFESPAVSILALVPGYILLAGLMVKESGLLEDEDIEMIDNVLDQLKPSNI